jgi:NitT/TauT family transport system substrate-binding protein
VYESFVTGMALAAALARGDIQAAYLCLVPAIGVRANAGVPIRIVAGTHRHGYGLVVNPEKIKGPQDLTRSGVRVGCVREGGAVDVFMRKTLDACRLDPKAVLAHTLRMNPPKLLLACRMGRLDAAFLPEQWASMAEDFGFNMLYTSRDVWPNMQGSVLAVKEELMRDHPDLVARLVRVTNRATDWLNRNPEAAARIVARQLSVLEQGALPGLEGRLEGSPTITPEVIARSMARMDFTTKLDLDGVQAVIDYMKRIGYIDRDLRAGDFIDMRSLRDHE